MAKPQKKSEKKENIDLALTEYEKKALAILDTQKLKRIMEHYKERYEDLVKEKKKATEDLQSLTSQFLHASGAMREKRDKVIEEKKLLEENIEESKAKYKAIIKKLEKEIADVRKEIDLKNEESLRIQEEKIIESKKESAYIDGFPEREKEYKERIDKLKNQIRDSEVSRKIEMEKIINTNQKQKMHMEAEHRQKIEDKMKNAREVASKAVEDSELRTQKQNSKLNKDLFVHQKEIQELNEETGFLKGENDEINRNIKSNQTNLQDYQSLYHKQSLKQQKLKEKIEYLKNFIGQEVSKYTKEIEILKMENEKKIIEAEYILYNLKEQIKKRNKDLVNLKGLSQIILDHRSDIEEFFLEALDSIKERAFRRISDEVYNQQIKDRDNQSQDSVNKKEVQPTLTVNREKFYENFRIADLTLEDREQLLRIIFSKMNSGIPPRHWRTPETEYMSDMVLQDNPNNRKGFDESSLENQNY